MQNSVTTYACLQVIATFDENQVENTSTRPVSGARDGAGARRARAAKTG